jgi:DNA modification methylase
MTKESHMNFQCAHKELVDLHKLQPNPKNPNKHPEKQIKLLAKIIDYQGQRAPIVVSNRSGFITKGHGRLEALKSLGWAKAAVDYQDYADEAQEYADMVADNKIAELATHDDKFMLDTILADFPDIDTELLGLDNFKLPKVLEPQCDEDEVPEQVDTRAKPGDVWQLGAHRLMCGDSTNIQQVEALMAGDLADMVFTDPPYGVNERTNRKDNKRFGAAESKNFTPVKGDESEDVAKEAFSIATTFGATTIYWGANNYSFLPISRGWIVWDKRENKGTDDNGDAELAWTNCNKPIRTFYHLWKGMIKSSERGESRVHPTQKPIVLAEWCFENYGNPKSVLDLFGGSGSTLIACEKTNRKCFMMELDPHYVDVILARWEKYTGKTAERLNGET